MRMRARMKRECWRVESEGCRKSVCRIRRAGLREFPPIESVVVVVVVVNTNTKEKRKNLTNETTRLMGCPSLDVDERREP
jgi:hypothetical protein